MIFPGFPGVLSFFQVFQVEWEPCIGNLTLTQTQRMGPIPISLCERNILIDTMLAFRCKC